MPDNLIYVGAYDVYGIRKSPLSLAIRVTLITNVYYSS